MSATNDALNVVGVRFSDISRSPRRFFWFSWRTFFGRCFSFGVGTRRSVRRAWLAAACAVGFGLCGTAKTLEYAFAKSADKLETDFDDLQAASKNGEDSGLNDVDVDFDKCVRFDIANQTDNCDQQDWQ